MRRGALGLALVCALVTAGASTAAEPPSAADLEAELVCPVCETTLDQSNAPIAQRMKTYIRQRIAAGATEEQIKDELVARFGPAVIAKPPEGGFGLLAWVLPIGAVGVGAVAVALLVRSWSRRRASPEAAPLDPALERRVDEELARFE